VLPAPLLQDKPGPCLTCTVAVRCLIMRKADLPLPRTVYSRPRTSTCSTVAADCRRFSQAACCWSLRCIGDAEQHYAVSAMLLY
jgi:hypothetical protein